MKLKMTAAFFLMGLLAAELHAGTIAETHLAPLDLEQASLTVVDPEGGEVQYSAEELERFPTYALTTTTPWNEEPTLFEGVLLSDILAKSHLDGAHNIIVTAENDYQSIFSKELLDSVQILVATRVDGRPHSRRSRGPIQFIIDADAFRSSSFTSEANLVWMAARIEGAD
jgi:hypothetical protein